MNTTDHQPTRGQSAEPSTKHHRTLYQTIAKRTQNDSRFQIRVVFGEIQSMYTYKSYILE